MKYYQATQKKTYDMRKEDLERQLAELEEPEVFEAVEHEGEPEEVETSYGKTVIMEGGALVSSAKQVVIVPKEDLGNPEIWLPAEEPKRASRKKS